MNLRLYIILCYFTCFVDNYSIIEYNNWYAIYFVDINVATFHTFNV